MNSPHLPIRGFSDSELAARLNQVQRQMAAAGSDAMLLTTAADIRYFSGFHTPFWQSPARPWFLIVPGSGLPVAVIPAIGEVRMRAARVGEIRTWQSPRPHDEGISELVAALRDVVSKRGRILIPSGAETHVRMPLADVAKMKRALRGVSFADATPMIQALRMVKSAAEINKIRRACRAASGAFAAAKRLFAVGMRISEVFRALKAECLRCGADDAPYLTGGGGVDGCSDIIAPPSEQKLRVGEILNLDLGCVVDGYYSDFNRNFAIGAASAAAAQAHRALFRATDAGLAVARAGVSCAQVFAVMAKSLEADGAAVGAVGRMGHGVGMELTEWPSISPDDETILQPGMVLALEPSAVFSSGMAMTHEENIVVGEGVPQLLSRRTSARLPEIGE